MSVKNAGEGLCTSFILWGFRKWVGLDVKILLLLKSKIHIRFVIDM